MLKKPLLSAMLFALIALLISIPLTSSSFAQGATATPIPVLPESTEGSAAPLAPGIVPPVVDTSGNPEATVEPEATAVVESTEDVIPQLPDTGNTCPIGVEDSFTATEILCTDTARGEACIGNGTVDADFGLNTNTSFSQSNDRVQVSLLDQLTLTSGSTWTVVRAQPELATTDGGVLVTATMFAYGNLTLTDTGRVSDGGAQTGTVLAERGMNVRRTPGNDGVVVWQLQGGQEITVTGISADREWIRIIIPNEFAGTGWVYAPYIEVAGGAETLAVVNENSPQPDVAPAEFSPGQSYELLSALPPTDCSEVVPISGLLMQSPSGLPDSLRIQINSAEIQFNGTIFVQAQAGEVLRISVLEGEAVVVANNLQAPASVYTRINVPLDNNLVVNGSPQSEAFDESDLPGVPTRILPRQIAFGMEPIDESVAVESDVESNPEAEATEATVFGTPQATTESTGCTLTATDGVRNVRAGASTLFEVVQVLRPGESVAGVGQALGELNLTWYQTETGGWLRIDTIESTAGCASLPVVEAPALPEGAGTSNTTESSMSSSQLAELTCDGTAITGSRSSNGTEVSISIGGTWSASAGTSATFTTQGGMLRPEFGDYIRLVSSDGTTLASSGETRSLTYIFEADAIFEVRFSAANNDTVIMAASCQ